MSKRVEITPNLQKRIRLALADESVDTSQFVVYEAKLLSTEPISQAGFYDKARVSVSTLREMEAHLNKEGSAVPLMVMHQTRGLLPVGKVFSAKMQNMSNGEVELRGQFFLPSNEVELITKIDTSVVDEVSVGLLSQHAFCSECNFDYFGTEASSENYWTLTCNEGHTIGQDGTHLRLVGMEDWAELSLVGRGAAKNAKILSRAKQSMTAEMQDRLAASSSAPLGIRMFTASFKLEPENQGELEMSAEFTALMGKFTEQNSELAQKGVELSKATEKVTALETENTALKASVKELETKVLSLEAGKSESVQEVSAKLATAEKELADATEKLLPHAQAALVASGVPEADLPKTLTATAAMIEEKGLKLHQIIQAGAASSGTKADDKDVGNTREALIKQTFFKK